MSRYLYCLLFYLLQPFIIIRLLLRSRRAVAYRLRWLERYGINQTQLAPTDILIHAVSVGETLAATPLIQQLLHDYPLLSITVTTTTPTGSAQLLKHFGEKIQHCYLPYDLPGSMRRFLRSLQPRLVIIMETEIWPNLLHQLSCKHIPIILANARLSSRSTQRYKKIPNLTRKILNQFSLIATQSESDYAAFQTLGCQTTRLMVMGNLKFNLTPLTEHQIDLNQLPQNSLNRPIWIAGSTHRGEESILLAVHRKLLQHRPDLLLILVPRHPERFQEVAIQIQSEKLRYQRRSDGISLLDSTQVLLGDSMGELRQLYKLADVAFIGGSLIQHGGQNPLEATYYGVPVIMGNSRFNFTQICQQLHQANLLFDGDNYHTILQQLNILLSDTTMRQTIKQRAQQFIQNNQQALPILMTALTPYLLSIQSNNDTHEVKHVIH